jgi:hypothetical protein
VQERQKAKERIREQNRERERERDLGFLLGPLLYDRRCHPTYTYLRQSIRSATFSGEPLQILVEEQSNQSKTIRE